MKFQNIYLVDDDELVRISSEAILKAEGYSVTLYSSGALFLEVAETLPHGCLLLDVKMPDVSGLDVLKTLGSRNLVFPTIMMSGHGDIPTALQAARLGALEFIEKPFSFDVLLNAIDETSKNHEMLKSIGAGSNERASINKLSDREKQILELLVQGDQNKGIAKKLGISHRTVEVHRARIMQRLNANSFAELIKIAVISGFISD